MVARGYSSISFLHSAAEAISAKGKPAYICHFGDLDPSGVDAARDIEAKLRRYAPEAEIHFERPAVTCEQVEQWGLPTRPTKMTDTRAKKFVGTSVELDAIPARQLRQFVRDASSVTSTASSLPSCAPPKSRSGERSAAGPKSSTAVHRETARGAASHDQSQTVARDTAGTSGG